MSSRHGFTATRWERSRFLRDKRLILLLLLLLLLLVFLGMKSSLSPGANFVREDLRPADVVSFTSHLVAACRALELERPDAMFNDPLAKFFAGNPMAPPLTPGLMISANFAIEL